VREGSGRSERKLARLNGISSHGEAFLFLDFELRLALVVFDEVGHFYLPIR
jgi:hypothetical protein